METGKNVSASPIKQVNLGSDLRRRTITGLIGAPIVVLAIILGQPAFGLLIIVTCAICVAELHRMICPDSRLGLIMLATLVTGCIVSLLLNNFLVIAALLILFLIVRLVEATRIDGPKGQFLLRNYVFLALGALYIGLPLNLLMLVRSAEKGMWWTGMLIVNNWATDSFALLGGRAFGKRKLAPKISPGKTIEGSLIGICCGFAAGVGLALLTNLPLNVALVANVLIAVLTVLGDLLESWIKRTFQVKDAGTILPGHGGIMDRVDGLILAGPGLLVVMMLMHVL